MIMGKSIISTALLLFFSLASSFCQSKGDMFITGMISFGVSSSHSNEGNTRTDNDPTIYMGLYSGYSYFVANKFRLGLEVDFDRQSQTDKDNDTYSVGSLSTGPVVAYYIQLADKFYLTPEIGAYFEHAKITDEDGKKTYETMHNGFRLGAWPILFEFRPTQRFAFAASLFSINYSFLSQKDSSPDYSFTSFSLRLGMDPTVGLRLYL